MLRIGPALRLLAGALVMTIVATAGLRIAGLPVSSPLVFNVSGSVPYHVGWLTRQPGELPARGALVLYRYAGAPILGRPELGEVPFFKFVRGLPGDEVKVEGRTVYVADRQIGLAIAKTRTGQLLEPIAPGRIPDGYFFAAGTLPDSFDSRYAESGLVPIHAVIGTVTPFF